MEALPQPRQETISKSFRFKGAADCRQKAILPPKGENSPFRK